MAENPTSLPPCTCTHAIGLHVFDNKTKRRKACGVWQDGAHCTCKQYQPVVSHE